jgi:alpha-D-ribose 1-methylphosphonate 5-phosphate C-P lyase
MITTNLETGDDSYQFKQRKKAAEYNEPTNLPGKYSMVNDIPSPVTRLAEAEFAFDDQKDMLNAGSDRRVFAIALATRLVFAGLAFIVGTPAQAKMP